MGDRFENVASVPKKMVLPLGEDREGGLFYRVEIDAESMTRRLDKDRVDEH